MTYIFESQAKQYYDDALHHLRATELPPSALEQLGKARAVFEAILDFGGAVAEVRNSQSVKVGFVVNWWYDCRCTLWPTWCSLSVRLHGRYVMLGTGNYLKHVNIFDGRNLKKENILRRIHKSC